MIYILKDVKERKVIFKYIKKDCKRMLLKLDYPPIIIRGIINEFKENNYRYQEIDTILNEKYEKIKIDISNIAYDFFSKNSDESELSFKEKLLLIFVSFSKEDNKEIWIHVLKNNSDFLKKELEDIVITFSL